jgi:hypothetical protein
MVWENQHFIVFWYTSQRIELLSSYCSTRGVLFGHSWTHDHRHKMKGLKVWNGSILLMTRFHPNSFLMPQGKLWQNIVFVIEMQICNLSNPTFFIDHSWASTPLKSFPSKTQNLVCGSFKKIKWLVHLLRLPN